MAEYTPSEGQVREWCCAGTGEYHDLMNAWITRFLERVKRDAARSAATEAMGALLYSEGASPRQIHVLTEWRDTHYPAQEDQT